MKPEHLEWGKARQGGKTIVFVSNASADLAARTLGAVAWAEANDVSVGVRKSGLHKASTLLHGENTFAVGKSWLEAIEALRAREPADSTNVNDEDDRLEWDDSKREGIYDEIIEDIDRRLRALEKHRHTTCVPSGPARSGPPESPEGV